MFFIAMSVCASLVVVLATRGAKSKGAAPLSRITLATLTAASLLLILPTVFIHCLLCLTALAVPAWDRQAAVRWAMSWAVVINGALLFFAMPDNESAATEEFPIVSLAPRLEFEQQAPKEAAFRLTGGAVITADVNQRLAAREDASEYGSKRGRMLRRLHRQARNKFYWGNGFGAGRMQYITIDRVRLPEREQPELPSPPASPLSGEFTLAKPPAAAAPDMGALFNLHENGMRDFLNADRFGWVPEPRQASGFVAHRFNSVPTFTEEQAGQGEDAPEVPERAGEDWAVTALHLVSLLRHESPRVYVSDRLPSMDELERYQTRELDDFEENHLSRLFRQEDVVIENHVNSIRMLGSIRAGRECLDCHDTRRGELLGAFTYTLSRMHPAGTATIPGPEA